MNGCGRIIKLLDTSISTKIQHQYLARNVGDYLIDPYVIVNHLSGIQYANFLTRTLPLLLDDIPFSVHDGNFITLNTPSA